MSILITICARGGSKGIPGKNIKLLNGKPLIAYSISLAQKYQQDNKNVDIALSTDSDEIKQVAEEFGLFTDYIRPDILAGDTVGKIDVITDLLNYYEGKRNCKYDYVLDLDITSPLRNLNDLQAAFGIIDSDKDAINLFSVSPAGRNPYFNMVEQKADGFYNIVKSSNENFFTRQSSPVVYDLNASFYFYKRTFFEKGYKVAITDKSLVYVVPHICFDLDHPIDFDFLSYLIKHNKLDFEL